MIVPMKKATIIVQDKDAQAAVSKLRSLGILHVEHINPPQGPDINILKEDISLINTCLDSFRNAGIEMKEPAKDGFKDGDWKTKARHIIDLDKRYEQLLAYRHTLANQISEWQRWGDFDPEGINLLSKKGIYIRFLEIPQKRLGELPKGAIIKSIFSSGGLTRCMVVSQEKFETGFKELRPPHYSLSHLRRRFDETEKAIASLKEEIGGQAHFYSACLAIKAELEQEIVFREALSGMGNENSLSYITGYLPVDYSDSLRSKAKEEKWGIVIRDPGESDTVPTLLRNPRWVSIIKPVFKLLEVIPGYHELDVSPLFLIFLSLFFGMIIGDAGYGAVYFVLTFLAQRKFGRKSKDKKVFFLFYLFSSCAILWGVITGTFFGQEWYISAGMKPLIPVLNDTKYIQAFCFFLGAFHLTLAHAWQAVRKIPSLTALADIGWICVLWAAFFLAKTLILGDPFPAPVKWLIIVGISMAVLFSSPQKNILKMVLQGLANVALSLMNNFTDVVSYIRLFAVGLATVAIADTVNTLAANFGKSNMLVMALIIFMGHTINIILGPISVMVHGIRLNVLEFSSHAGLTWSGVSYRPLSDKAG